jgi:hypothetical protein
VRRLTLVSVIFILALVVGTPAASARPLVESFPVDWVMTSADCANLPSGTTISGSGTATSITTVRTNAAGVTTVMNATHTHGTAIDQDGNVYVFDYSNEFRASNTVSDPDLLTGRMTDHFSLSGRGPAKLNNGFVADFSAAADFTSFSFDGLISSHGDPISFPEGVAHCDPL